MLDREDVAARLAAAVLQTTPASPAQRPGQSPDMMATCRYAVAVYETILSMMPIVQPGKAGEPETIGRRGAPAQRAANGPAPASPRR